MCLGSFVVVFCFTKPFIVPFFLSHANLCCTPTSHVGDGRPVDWSERDRNVSSGQRDLPPFLPNVRVHLGRRLLTRAPGQRLRLRVALPRPPAVPADAAHHLPAQAEEHHLLLLLGARLQQRGRELLHQHGDLQHLVSEVHHLLAVYVKEDMPLEYDLGLVSTHDTTGKACAELRQAEVPRLLRTTYKHLSPAWHYFPYMFLLIPLLRWVCHSTPSA